MAWPSPQSTTCSITSPANTQSLHCFSRSAFTETVLPDSIVTDVPQSLYPPNDTAILCSPGLSLSEDGVLPMETPSTITLAILGLELIERVPVLVEFLPPLPAVDTVVAAGFLGSLAGW